MLQVPGITGAPGTVPQSAADIETPRGTEEDASKKMAYDHQLQFRLGLTEYQREAVAKEREAAAKFLEQAGKQLARPKVEVDEVANLRLKSCTALVLSQNLEIQFLEQCAVTNKKEDDGVVAKQQSGAKSGKAGARVFECFLPYDPTRVNLKDISKSGLDPEQCRFYEGKLDNIFFEEKKCPEAWGPLRGSILPSRNTIDGDLFGVPPGSAMKDLYDEYNKKTNYVPRRSFQKTMFQGEEYGGEEMENAASAIQRRFRAKKGYVAPPSAPRAPVEAKKSVKEIREEEEAATKIQRRFRKKLAGKKQTPQAPGEAAAKPAPVQFVKPDTMSVTHSSNGGVSVVSVGVSELSSVNDSFAPILVDKVVTDGIFEDPVDLDAELTKGLSTTFFEPTIKEMELKENQKSPPKVSSPGKKPLGDSLQNDENVLPPSKTSPSKTPLSSSKQESLLSPSKEESLASPSKQAPPLSPSAQKSGSPKKSPKKSSPKKQKQDKSPSAASPSESNSSSGSGSDSSSSGSGSGSGSGSSSSDSPSLNELAEHPAPSVTDDTKPYAITVTNVPFASAAEGGADSQSQPKQLARQTSSSVLPVDEDIAGGGVDETSGAGINKAPLESVVHPFTEEVSTTVGETQCDESSRQSPMEGVVPPNASSESAIVQTPTGKKSVPLLTPPPVLAIQQVSTPNPFSWDYCRSRKEEEKQREEPPMALFACKISLKSPFVTSDKKHLHAIDHSSIPEEFDSIVYESKTADGEMHCVYMVRKSAQILPLYSIELEPETEIEVDKTDKHTFCHNCRGQGKVTPSDWSVELEGWTLCDPCLNDFLVFFPNYEKQKKVVPIAEMAPVAKKCPIHKGESMDLWCDECNRSLCQLCRLMGDHSEGEFVGHHIGNLQVKHGLTQAEIRKTKGYFDFAKQRLRKNIEQIDDRIIQVRENVETVLRLVRDQTKELELQIYKEAEGASNFLQSRRGIFEIFEQQINVAENYMDYITFSKMALDPGKHLQQSDQHLPLIDQLCCDVVGNDEYDLAKDDDVWGRREIDANVEVIERCKPKYILKKAQKNIMEAKKITSFLQKEVFKRHSNRPSPVPSEKPVEKPPAKIPSPVKLPELPEIIPPEDRPSQCSVSTLERVSAVPTPMEAEYRPNPFAPNTVNYGILDATPHVRQSLLGSSIDNMQTPCMFNSRVSRNHNTLYPEDMISSNIPRSSNLLGQNPTKESINGPFGSAANGPPSCSTRLGSYQKLPKSSNKLNFNLPSKPYIPLARRGPGSKIDGVNHGFGRNGPKESVFAPGDSSNPFGLNRTNPTTVAPGLQPTSGAYQYTSDRRASNLITDPKVRKQYYRVNPSNAIDGNGNLGKNLGKGLSNEDIGAEELISLNITNSTVEGDGGDQNHSHSESASMFYPPYQNHPYPDHNNTADDMSTSLSPLDTCQEDLVQLHNNAANLAVRKRQAGENSNQSGTNNHSFEDNNGSFLRGPKGVASRNILSPGVQQALHGVHEKAFQKHGSTDHVPDVRDIVAASNLKYGYGQTPASAETLAGGNSFVGSTYAGATTSGVNSFVGSTLVNGSSFVSSGAGGGSSCREPTTCFGVTSLGGLQPYITTYAGGAGATSSNLQTPFRPADPTKMAFSCETERHENVTLDEDGKAKFTLFIDSGGYKKKVKISIEPKAPPVKPSQR